MVPTSLVLLLCAFRGARLCRAVAQSLHIHIDLRYRHAQHLLNREFDAAHNIVRNLRDTQPILQRYIYIEHHMIVDHTHLHTLVQMLRVQNHRLPVMQARRGDAHHTIAFTDGLYSNSVDGIGKYLDFSQWPHAILQRDSRCSRHAPSFLPDACQNESPRDILAWHKWMIS